MSWNFRFQIAVGYPVKHPIQILQEAASVIALGGGFQNYINQLPDGSPDMPAIRKMSMLAEFMRERQPYCFGGKPYHQAALLLSTYDRGKESLRLYSRNGYEKIMGLTTLLCDAGQSLEIVYESTLEGNCNNYEMIVVPELFHGLRDNTVSELLRYAKEGGKLLLVGKKTLSLFSDSGAPFKTGFIPEFDTDEPQSSENGHAPAPKSGKQIPYKFTLDDDFFGSLISPAAVISDGEAVAKLVKDGDSVISSIIPYGKGYIAAVGFDIGSQYLIGCRSCRNSMP